MESITDCAFSWPISARHNTRFNQHSSSRPVSLLCQLTLIVRDHISHVVAAIIMRLAHGA